MYKVIGCLGCTVGEARTIDEAVTLVKGQLPIGKVKEGKMRNALADLRTGASYELEYGESGCTVSRL